MSAAASAGVACGVRAQKKSTQVCSAAPMRKQRREQPAARTQMRAQRAHMRFAPGSRMFILEMSSRSAS
jgi:hypothetical protein